MDKINADEKSSSTQNDGENKRTEKLKKYTKCMLERLRNRGMKIQFEDLSCGGWLMRWCYFCGLMFMILVFRV
jgi:hypothetical protein